MAVVLDVLESRNDMGGGGGKEERKCFIYGYMVSDIWLRTILIVRKETHCRLHFPINSKGSFICTIPQTK